VEPLRISGLAPEADDLLDLGLLVHVAILARWHPPVSTPRHRDGRGTAAARGCHPERSEGSACRRGTSRSTGVRLISTPAAGTAARRDGITGTTLLVEPQMPHRLAVAADQAQGLDADLDVAFHELGADLRIRG